MKFIARPHVERLVPGIDVSNDAVHSILLRRVGVGDQLLSRCVFRLFRAQGLRITEKKPLIACQTVQDGCRPAHKRMVIGVKGDQNSAEIGDVFVHGQVAVHMHARKRFEGAVLPAQLGGPRIEFARVSVRPPIGERARSVVFAPIVVEAVSKLMADQSTNPPVIDRWISRKIVIRSLQLRRRQDDLIDNQIVLPAAQLQAPYYDLAADPAVNYGGIGALIGHELTHGFDDDGRKYDGAGALSNWWTAADAREFNARAAKLSRQYSSFEPFPGVHVNGDLTMDENIADLGGVLVALDAYHHSLVGRSAPVLDGLTGDQRFFLGYAQTLRTKKTEDATRQQLVSDPHSPEQYRVNGVVRNIDAWYQAFNVRAGDKLHLSNEKRVRIW